MLALFNPKASVFGGASLLLVWVCCILASLVTPPELKGQNGSGLNHCGSPFTIADLDGDRMPDLALVQIVGYGSPKSKYSIRLQFSGGPGADLGIEAPLGGLRIDSRDVNGDDRNDLILSTLAGSVVAVLVNEGGGNFVVAKPSLFPDLERNPIRVVPALGAQMADERTLLQSRAAFGEETIGAIGRNLGAGSYLLPKIRRSELPQWPTHTNLGRSPPAVVCA